jgi:phosphatidylglycerophosphatase A
MNKSPRSWIAFTIATWFGCGLSPWGPGTFGALGAMLVAGFLIQEHSFGTVGLLLMTAVMTPIGIWAADIVATETARKDPSLVVVDEVVGMWLTLAGATAFNGKSALLAFLLFRIFDIWKPPPVRQLEKLPGGTGIIADDLMAGVYGALVLHIAGRLHFY